MSRIEGLAADRPLSLYIHIPFCRRKCDYCAFYSVPECSVGKDVPGLFTDITERKIEELVDEYGKPFHTIFIGGGNPGVLGAERITRLLKAATKYGRPLECTSEINPEDLTEEYLSIGLIDRISVGIQSMDGAVLKTLGRNADVRDNTRALEMLSASGKRFNADIITAVPGESVSTALEDIRTVSSYGAGHISYYCLTFEEGTPLVGRLSPVEEDLEIEFLRKGWKELSSLGYRHYEVSNFAKAGEECLHNTVYWELGQYIGIGPGAESSIGWERAVSLREPEDIHSYIQGLPGTGTRLTESETEEEFLMTALRTEKGIDKNIYRSRFGSDFDDRYSAPLSSLDPGLYRNTQDSFSLTEDGFMLLDTVILTLAGIL